MNLNDVDISDFYSFCGLYAVWRTRNRFTLGQLLKEEGTQFISINDLKIGDILVWETHDSYVSYPSKIKNNVLLTVSVNNSKHFGVYEGDGIVSDLSFQSDFDHNQWPILRMRELEKLTLPDRIIRYN